jgi:hypothetical protein
MDAKIDLRHSYERTRYCNTISISTTRCLTNRQQKGGGGGPRHPPFLPHDDLTFVIENNEIEKFLFPIETGDLEVVGGRTRQEDAESARSCNTGRE